MTPGRAGMPSGSLGQTEHLRTRESAPSSQSTAAHAPNDLGAARRASGGGSSERGLRGSGSSSEGLVGSYAERGLRDRECESNSAGPGAQGTGDTAQDPASPRDRQKPGGPREARTLLPQAEQISGPAPRASRLLQTESSVVTAGADSRAPELAPPLGLFLLGPHGVNNPH